MMSKRGSIGLSSWDVAANKKKKKKKIRGAIERKMKAADESEGKKSNAGWGSDLAAHRHTHLS